VLGAEDGGERHALSRCQFADQVPKITV